MADFSIRSDHSNDHLSISWKPSQFEWAGAEVEIKAGGFGGKYRCEFFEDELISLLPQLKRLYTNLSGSIEFVTLERQLEFKITGNGRGHFAAECEAQDSFDGSRLIFTLEFDQTHIPRMIRELEEMLT